MLYFRNQRLAELEDSLEITHTVVTSQEALAVTWRLQRDCQDLRKPTGSHAFLHIKAEQINYNVNIIYFRLQLITQMH